MAQSDYNVSNTSASSARSKINEVFEAIRTNNSGNASPTNTFANMWWYESDNNRLRMRNEADSGWHNVFYLDSSDSNISIIDGTRVRTTAGAETARVDTHSDSTWETGTNTSARLVSPAQVKAAVDANSFASSQSWQDMLNPSVQRSRNTDYTNNTGSPIMVSVSMTGGNEFVELDLLVDGLIVARSAGDPDIASLIRHTANTIVPPGSTYRVQGSDRISNWVELR